MRQSLHGKRSRGHQARTGHPDNGGIVVKTGVKAVDLGGAVEVGDRFGVMGVRTKRRPHGLSGMRSKGLIGSHEVLRGGQA